jgi:GNAT superfamily N-acetyltransferase
MLLILLLLNKNISMNNNEIKIRKAIEADSEKVWSLMKDLAVFEHYDDSFAITPQIVTENGFRKTPPDFYCIVAEDKDKIAGILVYYFLPYTAQNRPAVYMKELYVDDHYRGKKIGEQLMDTLREEAKTYGCTQIKWTVAPWNEGGKKFYDRLGAKENTDWLNYEWSI